MTTDINPAADGQTVKLTATVTPSGATGRVTFYNDGNLLGTAAVNTLTGLAVLNVSNLLPGSHSLTVSYPGDVRYTGSGSAPVSQVVTKRASSTALAASPSPAGCQQPVTLTATLTPSDATGSVEFFGGACAVGRRGSDREVEPAAGQPHGDYRELLGGRMLPGAHGVGGVLAAGVPGAELREHDDRHQPVGVRADGEADGDSDALGSDGAGDV